MAIYIRKVLFVVTILILSSVFIGKSYAPESQKFKVYVDVRVEEDDQTERDIIESHFKRELRALGDVLIVGEHADWEWRIFVTMIGIKNKDGTKSDDVTIAISIDRRVPKFYFKNYNFVGPSIPVYHSFPGTYYWFKKDLQAWCIVSANSFNKILQKSR